MERGSGRTTKQLLALEVGDVFVVSNAAMQRYTHSLARHLYRTANPPFRIVSVSAFSDLPKLYGLRGRIVVDHAYAGSARSGLYREVELLADAVRSLRPA
jgi:hypothetical protein